ncbi:RNA polymerase sigma factor [Pectobacterium polaris]|uniref:RNA polymerase sigma factor n=1 Tax=Pectobacterium polaris TaxID=2042057 RepID=UPI0015824708|nr:RNA polymerase sigma factor [Pectobacterium polaris]MCA6951095.1 RNA polymerase sigma factor [Pectobacterium polaris]
MVLVHNINVVDVFIDIQPTLQRIIYHRTGSKYIAQDLTQEMYFRVLSIANEFPSYNDARNYLIRIALNAATDYLRVERRRAQLLDGAAHLFADYSPSEEDRLYHKEQLLVIDSALSGLPEKCRDMLYLSRIEGLTHAEIAERMGVSRSLVEKYIVRALLHCREQMTKSENEKKSDK